MVSAPAAQFSLPSGQLGYDPAANLPMAQPMQAQGGMQMAQPMAQPMAQGGMQMAQPMPMAQGGMQMAQPMPMAQGGMQMARPL